MSARVAAEHQDDSTVFDARWPKGANMGFALLKLAGLYLIVLFMGILAFQWATWIGIAYSVFWVWFTYSQVRSAWKKN
jgi:hypothetical protein